MNVPLAESTSTAAPLAGPQAAASPPGIGRLAWLSVAVAIVYFLAATGASRLLPGGADAVLLVPAAGVAIAALLLWGARLLPAIFAGCFAAELAARVPLGAALFSGVLNAAAFAVVFFLLDRVARIDRGLGRIQDVLALAVLGAGTLALSDAARRYAVPALVPGTALPGSIDSMWAAALGAGVHVLVVAPPILTWYATRGTGLPGGQRIEAACLAAVTVALGVVVFGDYFMPMIGAAEMPYAFFPLVFWAALRFRPRETSTVVFAAAVIAAAFTAHGQGPFAARAPVEGTIALYLFLAVLATTGLLFAAVLAQRARADRLVRESEEKFRLIVENQTDLVLKVDGERRVVFASPSYLAFFGKREAEVLGRLVDVQIHEEDWPAVAAARASVVAPPHAMTVEHRVMTPSGWRWLSWSARGTVDANGALTAIFAVARDVTDRRRAEEQARQHLQQLAHVARVSSMGEMASAIAHEINQPLTAITNYAYACLRMLRSEQASQEDVLPAMQQVAREAERAGEVVRKMRSFVRGDEGQLSPVEVGFLIGEVLRLAAPEARQAGVELARTVAGRLPPVVADSIQIQQVLLNLVRNAVEAINAGGDPALREVRIAAARSPGGDVEITVEDTGPGLAPEALERVFEPFYTTKPDGIGIGLSLSRSIVDAHGGRLWATAASGRGATFHLVLPVIPGEKVADA